MLEVRPEDIEKKSFEILTSRMDENRLKFYSQDELLVVKRTIHTTADFDYQNNVIFQNNALQTIKDCIQSGAMIFTDTNMALSGINKRIAVGNAPTALIRINELLDKYKPDFIIAAPVGFVNVIEAKELVKQSNIPAIICDGNKGGSNVCAAILNAVLLQLAK